MNSPISPLKKSLCIIIMLMVIIACNKDDESPPTLLDCTVEVAECLTNKERQVYFSYSSDGNLVTNSCWKSIQMGFNMDGTFTWESDSDENENCRRLIGFDNFNGQWTLENNKTEIHITPPWFTNNFETKTVLKIVELNETDLVAITPIMTGATHEMVWRRLE